MEKNKVFKIIGSALLAVLVLVLFVGLALAPAFSPKALSDDDIGGSDVSTYADSSSPIGVWLMDESISLTGNDTVQVADFYYLTSSGSVSSSLCRYMRVETQDSLIKLYYCSSASDTGLYVYDTTSGWVDDNFRYISVVSAYEYDGFPFLASHAQKLSDNPYYGPFQPDTPEPPDPGPDPDPDPDPDPPVPDPDPDPDPGVSSPIGVWLFDESLSLSGNNTLQVADFYYLTSSGAVSSSLHQYMRLETLDDGSVKLYFSTSASDSGIYVYDTTSGWVNDNFRYISVVSDYEYPYFSFLAAGATKLSDDPYYGPFQPDTPEPPAPDPDPDPDPGDGSYDEGYDDGYNAGYDDGYLAGFNDGVLDDLKNPLVFFVQPIASFLDTPLFAGVSIGDMLALLIFIFVGLIFLRMFAGG